MEGGKEVRIIVVCH
jgi:hypothetical protein